MWGSVEVQKCQIVSLVYTPYSMTSGLLVISKLRLVTYFFFIIIPTSQHGVLSTSSFRYVDQLLSGINLPLQQTQRIAPPRHPSARWAQTEGTFLQAVFDLELIGAWLILQALMHAATQLALPDSWNFPGKYLEPSA